MTGDLNVVVLTGQIITEPIQTRINSNRTFATTFSLQCNEHYIDSTKKEASYYPNVFPVQCLGKIALSVAEKFSKGHRVWISGYLRSTDNSICVRAISVLKEETTYSQNYYQGLEHALDIAKSCRNKEGVVEALSKILQGKFNEG
jgi:hypothetical protein